MSAASKYTFDIEFRPEGDLVSNAARARQKKAYSTEEIDTLSARARVMSSRAMSMVSAMSAVPASAGRMRSAPSDPSISSATFA